MPDTTDPTTRGAIEAVREADEMVRVPDLPVDEYQFIDEIGQRQRDAAGPTGSTARPMIHVDQFRQVFDIAVIGMAIVGIDGRFLAVNQAMCDITGYSESELTGKTFQAITHPEDLKYDLEHVRRLLSGAIQSYQIEKRYIHRDGHPYWIQLSVSLIRDDRDAPQYFVVQVENIEARKLAEAQLIQQAFHDPLTRLPNRALFMDRVEHALARARRSGDAVAVLFLDLDNFKIVNDSFGHKAGDDLLSAIAERLRLCVRPGDTVARLGGDEFTILLESITDISDAVRVAERIAEQSQTRYSIEDRSIVVTMSVGIAVSAAGIWAEDLLRDADTAMYEAKRRGRSRYEVFAPSMAVDVRDRLELSLGLQQAIEEHELTVHYQPVIDLAAGRIVSLEALVRWEHPHRGLLLPGSFIKVAEESGLIIEIGARVIERVCCDIRSRQRQHTDLPNMVSVNLSLRQLLQPQIVETIRAALSETDIAPNLLQLEIPEYALLEDTEMVTSRLRELKALGVTIAIDDFGQGASSLRSLSRDLIDYLKIDRTIIASVGKHPDDTALVEAIIAFGHALGITVVAEGIETDEQYALLVAAGCDQAQGYSICAPVSSHQIDAILHDDFADQVPA